MKNRRFKTDPKKQIGARSNTTLFIFVSFAAILSLFVLGYLKLSDHGGDAQIGVKQKNQEQNVMPSPSLQDRMERKVQEALPEERARMVSPSVSELYGRWYTHIPPEGIAEFTFKPSGYELIYVGSAQGRLRKFSVGRYDYDPQTGYLGLFPDRKALPSDRYDGVRYKIMTARNFQMVVSKKPDNSMLYMRAHERDLAGKNYHPIFLYGGHERAPVLEFEPVVVLKK